MSTTTGGTSVVPGGLFIAFEGGDGAGKSTQVRLLGETLARRGLTDVVCTFEPGDTPVGKEIRHALLYSAGGTSDPRTEVLLYAADRAEHVTKVIRPALERGAVVLSDRYVDSSLAYQGAGRALATAGVGALQAFVTDGLVPDLTVLLDVDPVVGLARACGGGAADRIEAERLEFHQQVRAAYLDLAGLDPDRYLICDAHLPVEVLAGRIAAVVCAMIPTVSAVDQLVAAARGWRSDRSYLSPADGVDVDAMAATDQGALYTSAVALAKAVDALAVVEAGR